MIEICWQGNLIFMTNAVVFLKGKWGWEIVTVTVKNIKGLGVGLGREVLTGYYGFSGEKGLKKIRFRGWGDDTCVRGWPEGH